MKKLLTLAALALTAYVCPAQTAPVAEPMIYPTHWWTGMKNHNLQLLIHATDVGKSTDVRVSYPGVRLVKVSNVENPNYLVLDLVIDAAARSGGFPIRVSGGSLSKPYTWNYVLKPRRKGNGTAYAQGVRSQDFIYLLMPDRFANGDPSNDRVPGLRDQSLARDSIFHRHGGDLQGVIDHLGYLQDLGVTTVWLTPVLENDMPNRTEHGYAITEHYRVDPRLGGDDAYRRLSDSIHARGMKLIQDAVYNHCGLYHALVQDLPMKDWLHQWPRYTQTSYKDQPIFDPHGAASDRKVMADGWFTRQMPDLNQSNPYVANFLIQNAIWSVEEFGVDGWRIDTYIYNDLAFMNRCNQALIDEFPRITMFGETWVHGTANQAYFARNNINVPFKSNLIGVTDFQANLYGINPALTQKFGWTEGVNKLYETLSNDFLYQDATNNVIFLDNHDMTRFLSQVNENTNKLKVGIGWLLTSRGIPQLYYGTEVGMKGVSNPDGYVRLDFPGGWPGDAHNKFTAGGRNPSEDSIYNWTRTLARFRQKSPALKTGKLVQYVPNNGVYVYFRVSTDDCVMIVMNTDASTQNLDPSRFREMTRDYMNATDIITKKSYPFNGDWNLAPESIMVLKLNNKVKL